MYSRFLDRDMVMRYRGGGVGHKSTRQATQCVFDDRDELDYLSCSTVQGPSGGSGHGENDGDDSSSELEFPHSSDGENDDNDASHSQDGLDLDKRGELSESGEDSGSESEQTESDGEDDGFAEY